MSSTSWSNLAAFADYWRCGRCFHVDDDSFVDVDQIVEPVADLHALVGLCRPGGWGIGRRDHLRRFAIRIGFDRLVERSKIFAHSPRLTLLVGPISSSGALP
jgi:hypothetical protein